MPWKQGFCLILSPFVFPVPVMQGAQSDFVKWTSLESISPSLHLHFFCTSRYITMPCPLVPIIIQDPLSIMWPYFFYPNFFPIFQLSASSHIPPYFSQASSSWFPHSHALSQHHFALATVLPPFLLAFLLEPVKKKSEVGEVQEESSRPHRNMFIPIVAWKW